jgi:hypothetical protein
MPLRYLAPRPSNSKSLPPAASLSICAAAVLGRQRCARPTINNYGSVTLPPDPTLIPRLYFIPIHREAKYAAPILGHGIIVLPLVFGRQVALYTKIW